MPSDATAGAGPAAVGDTDSTGGGTAAGAGPAAAVPGGGRPQAPASGPPAGVDELRRAVAAHLPGDAREEAARQRILAELGRLRAPFDEHADPLHVTGSAVIVGRRGTVLHLHRRLGRWMQTGGHVDPGESPAAAAWRESQEETGLALQHPAGGPVLLHVDVHPAAKGHTHLDIRYLLLGPDDDPHPPPGESPLARWYRWDDAFALADDALRGALVAARRHPLCPAGGATGDPSDPGPSRQEPQEPHEPQEQQP